MNPLLNQIILVHANSSYLRSAKAEVEGKEEEEAAAAVAAREGTLARPARLAVGDLPRHTLSGRGLHEISSLS